MAARGRATAWAAAEAREAPGPSAAVPAAGAAAADEVLRCVRPTEASERCRAEVVDYVRSLVGAALGCEVFAYGSVPLKTYLPDGDIDLTILGNASHDSTLVNDVYCVLESEDQNSDAEFEVKDLARIDAEVRLIKCTIDNIIVDISFNQTGGICALCFLELVDRKVGKDHLFKRSIILIKAWCYYESRLLGAHHGLISTYALEILILYIFNLFHKSLHCPLEVLYRFLEYFSKFDWDNYCISLNGPVALSSLPTLTVEAITHTDDLLFDKEFLKSSVDKAAVLPGNSDGCYSIFRPKYLNIIDPLKEHNNLGRSVHRASFHRIRTAFSYGARKLGQILMLPSEVIPDEIFRFFKNTLERNRRGVRPDISSVALDPSIATGELLEDISTMTISYKKEDEDRTNYHLSKSLDNDDSCVGMDGPTHLSRCFSGFCSSALSTDLCTVSSHFVSHAPTQYSSFYKGNGDHYYTDKSFNVDTTRPSIQSEIHVDNPSFRLNSSAGLNNSELATDMKNCSAVHVGKQHLPPSLLSLPDLSGDLDSQFSCLRQVQYHLEYLFDGFLQSVKVSPADEFHKDQFHVPTLSISLNMDSVSPRLTLPSSCKRNGRTSSPVSCYLSTKDVSQDSQSENPWDVAYQQNISLPYVTDVPASQNEDPWGVAYQQGISLPGSDVPTSGLSPSSYVDSDMSSVFWCYSPEGTVEMHRTDTYFPRKINDTHMERLASPRENGKIMTNQAVIIGTNQALSPRGSFIPHKEQVVLDSRTKQIIGQPLKVLGRVHSDRKNVEKLTCDAEKEFVRHGDEAGQIPKHSQDVCSNKNFWQKRCHGTDMESTRSPIVTDHIPKYEPSNIQSTAKECTRDLIKNWPRKQSCGSKKGHEILNWPTKQIPICEPLKLQDRQRSRDCSKKISAGKQNYNNHKEHLSFVRAAEQMPCRDANLNGLEREVNSTKPVENGNQRRPLLPELPLSCHNIGGQEKSSVSNTSQSSFPVANGQPVETIEFGSLGPFSLNSSSLKPRRDMDKITTSKVFTHASALVLQRSSAGTTENRSPGFWRVGDEDEFPPLSAGIR